MVLCDVTQTCHVTHRIGDACTGPKKVHMCHLIANVAVGYVRHDAQTCDVFVVTYSRIRCEILTYVTLLIHIPDITMGICDKS